MPQLLRTAVILAAGMGTRMREPRADVALEPAQSAMADIGLKAMIPIGGRPFLDYVLAAIADAGYTQACIVVSDAQQVLRDYYTSTAPPTRLRLAFATQRQPRGTADAIAAAESSVGGEDFLVVNGDNYYPVSALAGLRVLGEPGLVGFDPEGLIAGGNISPDRLGQYAVAFAATDGYLERLVEKPGPAIGNFTVGGRFISMTCWRFSPRIFTACRAISPSVRNELELAAAVQYAADVLRERFRVVPSREPVLDLSNRGDIPRVAARLRHLTVLT